MEFAKSDVEAIVDKPAATEKFFISLSLPEQLRVRLASAKDSVLSCVGDLVGRPMNPNKYHITLAVVLMPPNMDRTEWDEITTHLVRDVRKQLDLVEGKLCASQVGKFGDGAVYLEVCDRDGSLGSLRRVVTDLCERRGLVVAESECFHITLFRENKIEQLPSDLREDYKCSPVEFGVGPVRLGGDRGMMANELFSGKVRGQ